MSALIQSLARFVMEIPAAPVLGAQAFVVGCLATVIGFRAKTRESASAPRSGRVDVAEAQEFSKATPKDVFLQTAREEIEAYLDSDAYGKTPIRNPYLRRFLQ